MKLAGARIVGLLLVWMAAGFFFEAATAQLQYDVLREAAEEEDAEAAADLVPPTVFTVALSAGLGLALFFVGGMLVLRDPGRGLAPGVALGHELVVRGRPRRCWKCRARWPPSSPTCPRCGAERLR